MYKYAYAAKILRIDDLDTDNCAVYLDCDPFDTTPVTGGSATQYIYMSSWHYDSGCTDVVIGHHDGSPTSNTDGKHPYRIQGLEFNVGGWTIPGDTVMIFNADYSKDVYRAPRGVAHSSSEATIKNTYTKMERFRPSQMVQIRGLEISLSWMVRGSHLHSVQDLARV